MKTSRRLASLFLALCLLLSSVMVVTALEEDPPVVPVRNNVALSSNGGRVSLGAGTNSNPGASPLSVVNDGVTTSGSWNDWNNTLMNSKYPNDVYLILRFNSAYTVDSIEVYFYYDGGGVFPPVNMTLQYWDGEQYINVENQSMTNGFTRNGNSLVTFAPVKTTRIQAVMTHQNDTLGRAIGINEFAVYTSDAVAEIVYTPEIPLAPVSVNGVAQPVIDLNESTGDGTWKFLFESPAGVPLPDDDKQNFDFTAWNGKEWHNIIVPGGLLMQGFDIRNNTEYFYQRSLPIPADYAGKRTVIRFDAVYSNARVWIDGKYVMTHKGGFTTWMCDITDFVTPGETSVLTVGVADIDGTTVGTWNQTGESMADPSGGSYYANHNIGGITRDVTLMAYARDYLARIHTNTDFDADFINADLEVEAQLRLEAPAATLKLDVVDKDGLTVASGSIDFLPDEPGKLTMTKKITIPVTAPLQWDAEHPNLYTLKTTVVVDGVDQQVSTQRIGFREITYAGGDGFDSNKIYINGKEIKLRGVCRHDLSYDLGRSTLKELDYQEIRDYKDANINFIRTSHYPVSKHLLDACDELGMYVEEENAACWGPVNCPPEEYLNGFKDLLERDRNRACILIWSIANESSWALPFEMSYNYVKSEDLTRPVVFSYPDTAPITFDIRSVHYDSWNSTNLGHPTMPVLHDEYSPSAVHHYYEIQRDLNVRNFYGESTFMFWENMFQTDGALGGAHWAANDEIFFIPDGTSKRRGAQGYYDGPTTGDGEWGVVHDAFKRLKPEAWNTKKSYSPIRVDEKVFYRSEGKLIIPIKNWFDHTDLNEVTLAYSVDGGAAERITLPSIAPHGVGSLTLDLPDTEAKQVNLKFYTSFNGVDSFVDEYNIDLVETTFLFVPASEEAPGIAEDAEAITVSGDDFSVVFSKETGLIQNASFKGETLITGGPYFHATYIDFGKWIPAATGGITAALADNLAVITLKGAYANGQGVTFTVSISKNGILTTDYTLTTTPERTTALREVGVSYDIPSDIESVSWIREAFHSVYPEGHIGRAEGTALKVRENADTDPDVYGVKPAWGWEADMNDFSLYVNEDPNDGIVTNDFKSMREHVWTYDVNFTGTDSRLSVESDASVAARVEVTADWDLVDDRDARVKYTTGTWAQRNNHVSTSDGAYTPNYSYNRTEMTSSSSNASCEFTFVGTGVSFISARQSNSGYLNVYIDGEFMEQFDAYSPWGQSKKRVLYSINSLPYGEHTIRVQRVTGTLAVDAFAVLNKNPMDQLSKLIINEQWYYPNLSWGSYPGIPGTLKNGLTGSATLRLTDTQNYIPVESEPVYVPVTDIIDVPTETMAAVSVSLTASLVPADATNQTIIWSIKDAGSTGATLKGNVLTTVSAGQVVVTATIMGGEFSKDFTINARDNLALASRGAVMYVGPGTFTETGRSVHSLNNAIIGRGGGYWTDFSMANYNSSYPTDATIGVELPGAYTVDTLELYIMDDRGGVYPPSQVTVQYWNEEEGAFKNVDNQLPVTGFVGNEAATVCNTITFTPVKTNKIQAVMAHVNNTYGRAIALTEFAVYAAAEQPAGPTITNVEVTTPTIVETLAANLRVNVEGENWEGKTLTAYLCVDDVIDEATATDVTSGTGLMKITKAPAADAVCEVVAKVDGTNVEKSFAMALAAYDPDALWKPDMGKDAEKLLITFSASITPKTGGYGVKIGGQSYSCEQMGDNALLVDIPFDTLSPGTAVIVSGVKYPVLFPSYSFTFTLSF